MIGGGLQAYSGRRVFVTGHTGFKGAWLCAWLQRLGAHTTGFALPPESRSLFLQARIADRMDSREGDVRDIEHLRAAVAQAQPEIVFHMAAQSLVRPSYEAPIETFATNVMGTAHLLEAVRGLSSVRSVVIVTSDKCYENDGRAEPFVESSANGRSRSLQRVQRLRRAGHGRVFAIVFCSLAMHRCKRTRGQRHRRRRLGGRSHRAGPRPSRGLGNSGN